MTANNNITVTHPQPPFPRLFSTPHINTSVKITNHIFNVASLNLIVSSPAEVENLMEFCLHFTFIFVFIGTLAERGGWEDGTNMKPTDSTNFGETIIKFVQIGEEITNI